MMDRMEMHHAGEILEGERNVPLRRPSLWLWGKA